VEKVVDEELAEEENAEKHVEKRVEEEVVAVKYLGDACKEVEEEKLSLDTKSKHF
jgi:hypothetical protein